MNSLSAEKRLFRSFVLVASLFLAIAVFAQKTEDATNHKAPVSSPQCRVKISWKAETETNAFGYLVFRGTKPDDLVCINEDHPLHAIGTTTTPAWYRYYDRTAVCGTQYFYRVAAVDLDGTKNWIIGEQAPVEATGKPLSAEELKDIEAHGERFRIEESSESPDGKPASRLAPR